MAKNDDPSAETLARRAKLLKQEFAREEQERTGGLEAEKRSLGMIPCPVCDELFLPDPPSQPTCSACAAAPLQRSQRPARAVKTLTRYDPVYLVEVADQIDGLATVVVVLSTILGALGGWSSALRLFDTTSGGLGTLGTVAMVAVGALIGLGCGRLLVLGMRLTSQLSRCLVEIERRVGRGGSA